MRDADSARERAQGMSKLVIFYGAITQLSYVESLETKRQRSPSIKRKSVTRKLRGQTRHAYRYRTSTDHATNGSLIFTITILDFITYVTHTSPWQNQHPQNT